jgi:Signal transduction histidine kinase
LPRLICLRPWPFIAIRNESIRF